MVFVGSSQKWVPIEVVASARTLGHRVQWHRVDGNGSNALDFHIACQLGRVLEKTPCIHCIVLSKDKGFDPLLRHQNRSGLKCGRMNSLLELDPKGALTEEPNDKRVLELLRKTEKKSCSRKEITELGVDRIIEILFAKKVISESKKIITSDF